MKRYDIFAKPIGSNPEHEFLALHNYSGDIDNVKAFAAARGCEITRIYDLDKPVDKPNFAACVSL